MVSQFSLREDDDDIATQATQPYLDPRRLGEKDSGLSEVDVENVMCILHPASPAAFRAVRFAAQHAPQHVLQHRRNPASVYRDLFGTEEQETFILGVTEDDDVLPMDLALRFSSPVVEPRLGFCFGRDPTRCDIVFNSDPEKRTSNLHFRIFLNDNGVVMLEDQSTNGTIVDNKILHGRTKGHAYKRMLTPGAIIEILSSKKEELIKFIVRIPTREGHVQGYTRNFHAYMQEQHTLKEQLGEGRALRRHPAPVPHVGATTSSDYLPAPLMTSSYTYGMKWDGRPEYNVTGVLGKGAFATVYRLATAMDGELFAAKELEKSRLIKDGKLDQKLDNEMRIMKALEHPHIVKYIDYKDVANHLYIIMEYVPCGDLARYLVEHKVLSEARAKLMSAQTLDALSYLHHKKITHRDIKPDNILIASEEPFLVKLSDFGLSKATTDNQTFMKTFCGTLLYCAPEVFPHYTAGEHANQGRKRRRPEVNVKGKQKFHSYSSSVDVWSYAAVLWSALVGQPPFEGVVDTTGRGMFEKIMTTPLNPKPLLAQNISAQAVDLLLQMLNTDPSLRPTEIECLRHPWLVGLAGSQSMIQDSNLDDIIEEDESAYAEGKMSQLNLESDLGREEFVESVDDEFLAEFASSNSELIDPRKSKRPRPHLLSDRPVSSDSVDRHIQARLAGSDTLPPPGLSDMRATANTAGAPRLFGEIGRSALESSGLLGRKTDQALDMGAAASASSNAIHASDMPSAGQSESLASGSELLRRSSTHDLYASETRDVGAESTSLNGAEAMMRDVNMDSPTSATSPANEPKTPLDTESANASSRGAPSQEITPKAPLDFFRREIDLPESPSFLERRTGRQRVTLVDEPYSRQPSDTGMPFTGSNVDDGHKHQSGSTDPDFTGLQDNGDNGEVKGVFAKPAPVLGKMTLTRNTSTILAPQTIRMDKRTTSWGRGNQNTHIYPVEDNVVVPRLAFAIMFYGREVDAAEKEGRDFTRSAGLHTIIASGTSRGISVNGVRLSKHNDVVEYGRIHTGDEITVPLEEGGELTWVVELHCGEGEKARTHPFKRKSQKSKT